MVRGVRPPHGTTAPSPVAVLASLNDFAYNFGHALFDFLFPVFNQLQLLGLYHPNFQLLLASHQVFPCSQCLCRPRACSCFPVYPGLRYLILAKHLSACLLWFTKQLAAPPQHAPCCTPGVGGPPLADGQGHACAARCQSHAIMGQRMPPAAQPHRLSGRHMQGNNPGILSHFIRPPDPSRSLLSLISAQPARTLPEVALQAPPGQPLTCWATLVAGSGSLQTTMQRTRALPFR